MTRRGAVRAALALAVVVGVVGVVALYRHERAAPAPSPASLLASVPPLPRSFADAPSAAAERLDWRVQPGWTQNERYRRVPTRSRCIPRLDKRRYSPRRPPGVGDCLRLRLRVSRTLRVLASIAPGGRRRGFAAKRRSILC
jgi:hypothetical protein